MYGWNIDFTDLSKNRPVQLAVEETIPDSDPYTTGVTVVYPTTGFLCNDRNTVSVVLPIEPGFDPDDVFAHGAVQADLKKCQEEENLFYIGTGRGRRFKVIAWKSLEERFI